MRKNKLRTTGCVSNIVKNAKFYGFESYNIATTINKVCERRAKLTMFAVSTRQRDEPTFKGALRRRTLRRV